MAIKPKTVWILNQYASSPQTGYAGRHFYLAKELAKQGHKVYLVAASYTHLLRKPPIVKDDFLLEEITENFSFVWVKTPRYDSAHDKKRVFNWFVFSWRLLKLPNVTQERPDAILFSSPSLIPFLSAKWLAKKHNTKLLFEVRDIWPLTLIELGGISPKHLLIRFMQWIEDKAYKDSDLVLSNLPNAIEHMLTRGLNPQKFHWIPNGFDYEEVSFAKPLEKDLVKKIPRNKFLVGYTGTFGVANALDSFIEATKALSHDHDVVFVLVGNGKEKQSLIDKTAGQKNVVFLDAIEKTKVQSMLSFFDVCFIGWNDEPIYRFGIAPNKLPEYMFSTKPIIHAYSGSHDAVKEANAGVCVPANNVDAIVEAVIKLKDMSADERNKLGQSGHSYAVNNYDYAKLAKKLSVLID